MRCCVTAQQQPDARLTPDAETNALLRELSGVDADREPARAEALCRQILALDEQRHALTSQLRPAVLATLGHTLLTQALSRRYRGPRGWRRSSAAADCYDRRRLRSIPPPMSLHSTQAMQSELQGNTRSTQSAADGRRHSGAGVARARRRTAYRAALAALDPTADAPTLRRRAVRAGEYALDPGAADGGDQRGWRCSSAAADAYRAALAALDPTADAPTYAGVQLGLGNTLLIQAERTAGTAGLALLSAAADAYRAVLAALDPPPMRPPTQACS